MLIRGKHSASLAPWRETTAAGPVALQFNTEQKLTKQTKIFVTFVAFCSNSSTSIRVHWREDILHGGWPLNNAPAQRWAP